MRFGPARDAEWAQETSLEEMYEATRGTLLQDEVKRRILLGTFALSSGYYDAYDESAPARCVRSSRAIFTQAFEKCDVILGPTTPTVSFEAGLQNERSSQHVPQRRGTPYR